jgi:hypothetical protein
VQDGDDYHSPHLQLLQSVARREHGLDGNALQSLYRGGLVSRQGYSEKWIKLTNVLHSCSAACQASSALAIFAEMKNTGLH